MDKDDTYSSNKEYVDDMGFSGGTVVKNLPASAVDPGWIPGLGRSPTVVTLAFSSLQPARQLDPVASFLLERPETDRSGV